MKRMLRLHRNSLRKEASFRHILPALTAEWSYTQESIHWLLRIKTAGYASGMRDAVRNTNRGKAKITF